MYNCIIRNIEKDSGLSTPRIVCEKERKIHCNHSFNSWNDKKRGCNIRIIRKKIIYK